MIKLNGDEDTLVTKKWVFIPFDCNKRSPASDFKSEDNFDLMPSNFDRALFQFFFPLHHFRGGFILILAENNQFNYSINH